MTPVSPQEQHALARRAATEKEEEKAKELEADVAWLRRAAGEIDTLLRTADRFARMIQR